MPSSAPSSSGGVPAYGAQSMIAPLRRAIVRRPGEEYNLESWQAWGFPGEPDLERATREHDGFTSLLEREGVELEYMKEHGGLGTTATYDASLVTNEGAVILQSGRPERRSEMLPMARTLTALDIPVIGWLRGEACVDGGDTLWLDSKTLLVGRSYRSNDEGYRQLRVLLDGIAENFAQFELPHWRGPDYVLHLMSVVNLISEDLAVIYPPAMPVRLWELIHARGYRTIEVPDEEFDTQAANILTLSPNRVVMCAGNPITQGKLEDEGVEVHTYEGGEISVRWVSGPTCNTRPVLRA